MKPTILHRCLKAVLWLWVIAIIVMLLIPSELTDEQLEQIQPGMPLNQIKAALGIHFQGEWTHYSMAEPIEGTDRWGFRMTHHGQFWNPTISLLHHSSDLNKEHCIWIGKRRLLWVEHNNGIVTKTWLFPITRWGGGLEGCISSLKYYCKRQMGTLSTSTSPK